MSLSVSRHCALEKTVIEERSAKRLECKGSIRQGIRKAAANFMQGQGAKGLGRPTDSH